MTVTLDDWQALARFCRKLRTDAGMTQKQLAEAAGLGRTQRVSNAESEEQPSRRADRERILAHFGYTLDDSITVRKVRNI